MVLVFIGFSSKKSFLETSLLYFEFFSVRVFKTLLCLKCNFDNIIITYIYLLQSS